jgi:hypothetical protein
MGPQPSTKGPVKNRSIFVGSVVIVDLLLTVLPLKALSPNLDPVQPVQDFLQKYGVTLSLEWDADIFANVRGGKEQGPVTDGLVQLGLDFDLKTLTRQDIFEPVSYTSRVIILMGRTFPLMLWIWPGSITTRHIIVATVRIVYHD